MGAEAQDVEHGRVEAAEGAVEAVREDRVVAAAQAQGAVGELGGEAGVTSADAALAQQGWQDEVGVGVGTVDLAQDVVRDAPCGVGALAALGGCRRAAVGLPRERAAPRWRPRASRRASSPPPDAAPPLPQGAPNARSSARRPVARHRSNACSTPRRPDVPDARSRSNVRSIRAGTDRGARRSSGGLRTEDRGVVEPGATRPVGGGHVPLAHRRHLPELDGVGRGPDEHLLLARTHLPGSEVDDVAARGDGAEPQARGRAVGAGQGRPRPGAGVQPRTRRSTASAGGPNGPRRPRSSAWRRARRRRRAGAGAQGAVLEGVEGGDEEVRTGDGEAAQEVARGVPGRMVSVVVPSVGPESSPSSMRNVVAPVTSSPAMIARCTGAAPRQAGRTEKCRLTHPCRGTASTSGRRISPYATTGATSTSSAARRARTPRRGAGP